MKTLSIDKLPHTEKGYLPETKFKSLIELPYDYIRCRDYDKYNEFGAEFCDFDDWVGNEDDDPCFEERLHTTALFKHSCYWVTREQYKRLKKHQLI